ncbi:hypothetical protein IGI04_015970 [Brassica rapa subsp. trilocularis]|uniref:Uncharacterized protein n=1 Tax=Brassica rapa subsp. trilocularis TaxID=1813537 RepID=A0ABQ7MRL8_BRACM|nr:hypothetical protein IGI04_015970 [Brassica rapa subsp. trilocularis]
MRCSHKTISNYGLSITISFATTVVSFFCNIITTSFTTTTFLTIHRWCSCEHHYPFPTTSITHPTTSAVIICFFFHDCLRVIRLQRQQSPLMCYRQWMLTHRRSSRWRKGRRDLREEKRRCGIERCREKIGERGAI